MLSKLLKQLHPFVTATVERAQPFWLAGFEHVLANLGREAEEQSENRARMDAADQYEAQVLRQTVGLMATIQVLEDARRMISVFPTKPIQGAAGVSRDR